MSFQAYFSSKILNNYDNSQSESVYKPEESKVLMYPCQTDPYYLPTRKSYRSIVLRIRFDWLVFFKVARFELSRCKLVIIDGRENGSPNPEMFCCLFSMNFEQWETNKMGFVIKLPYLFVCLIFISFFGLFIILQIVRKLLEILQNWPCFKMVKFVQFIHLLN